MLIISIPGRNVRKPLYNALNAPHSQVDVRHLVWYKNVFSYECQFSVLVQGNAETETHTTEREGERKKRMGGERQTHIKTEKYNILPGTEYYVRHLFCLGLIFLSRTDLVSCCAYVPRSMNKRTPAAAKEDCKGWHSLPAGAMRRHLPSLAAYEQMTKRAKTFMSIIHSETGSANQEYKSWRNSSVSGGIILLLLLLL